MSDSFVTPWTIATRLLYPWDFPGKNTGVDCHFQGIFLTQGLNPDLLYWQAGFLTTEPPGKPLECLKAQQYDEKASMKHGFEDKELIRKKYNHSLVLSGVHIPASFSSNTLLDPPKRLTKQAGWKLLTLLNS